MTDKKISGLKLFAALVTLLVAAAVVVGIIIAGSPSQQRARTLDQQRANSLSQITGAIEAYYASTFALPTSLDALAADSRTQYALPSLKDPGTGATFEYRTINATTYELCATFAFPSDNSGNGPAPASAPMIPAPAPGAGMNWYVHAAGRVCQDENVTLHAPFQYCGSGTPGCAGGATCLQLPGKNAPICVPTGKECAAAGCGGATCSLDKSTPPQVTCDTGNTPTK